METLKRLNRRQLAEKWTACIGETRPQVRKNLLIKFIYFYQQAQKERLSVPKLMRELAKTAAKPTGKPALPCGSKLVRSYKGILYEVETREEGYLCQGRIYKTLSGVAKVITGKHWNGKVFFGVNNGK